MLKGYVNALGTAQQAAQIASTFGSSVLNFLEVSGGEQVMLEVRFAEVSRSASTELGFNFNGTDGKSVLGFNNGPGATSTLSVATNQSYSLSSSIEGLRQAAHFGSASLEYFLDALRS